MAVRAPEDEVEALARLLWEKYRGKPITLDRVGKPNPFVVRALARSLLEIAYGAGVKDPLHEIDWEGVIDPNLGHKEVIDSFITWLNKHVGKKVEVIENIDRTISEVERYIHHLRDEIKKAPPDVRPSLEEELRKWTEELDRLRNVKKPEVRKVSPPPTPLPKPVEARPPPKVVVRVEEVREHIRRNVIFPKVYRIDWRDDRYEGLGARISYHRVVEDELKRRVEEVGGKIEKIVEAAPPLKVMYVDFRGVKPPIPITERLAKLRTEFLKTVEGWATLYLPKPKKEAFMKEAEREFKEAEPDIRRFLEEGKEELVKEEVEHLLRSKARLIVSLNRKALEHPEISKYSGIIPPPTPPRPPPRAEVPEVIYPMRLSPEAAKWAKWFAKLERALMAPPSPKVPIMPTISHRNPWISAFPPTGERINRKVILHERAYGGLAKIGEILGIKVPIRIEWDIDELRAILDEIHRRGSKDMKEWVDVLREVLGI